MEFFKRLAPLLDGADLNLTVRGGEKSMVVLITVKGSEETAYLPPISMNGPAEEIDQAFFAAISEPVKSATTLIIESSAMEAAAKAKKAEASKKTETTVASKSPKKAKVETKPEVKTDVEDKIEAAEEVAEKPPTIEESRTIKLNF